MKANVLLPSWVLLFDPVQVANTSAALGQSRGQSVSSGGTDHVTVIGSPNQYLLPLDDGVDAIIDHVIERRRGALDKLGIL